MEETSNEIQSYVILDLETSGIANISVKITEISILGVIRPHILENHKDKNFMPRVMQKVNLCVYPKRAIHPKASDVSGLTNELLEHCQPFNDDIYEVLIKVINLMPPPVCILAHNGIKFDYPILLSEIEKIGRKLPDDLLCADTLVAFRELLSKTVDLNNDDEDVENQKKEIIVEKEEIICESQCHKVIIIDDEVQKISVLDDIKPLSNTSGHNIWGSQSWDDVLHTAGETAEKAYMHEIKNLDLESVRQINETTPKGRRGHKTCKPVVATTSKSCVNSDAVGVKKEAKKNLIKEFNELNRPKLKFRLMDCYLRLTGKEIVNAHRADSDTHALLECVVASGPSLLNWIDSHCQPINSIKRRW